MFERNRHLRHIIYLIIALFLASCQQLPKCQQNQPIKSLIGQDFRLINTTNPQFLTGLDNYNFTVIRFTNTFTCQVFQVVNNFQYTQPTLNCSFKVVNNILTIQYYTPPVAGSAQNSSDPNNLGTPTGSPEEYKITYGTIMKWDTQRPNNYTYSWVINQGGVSPDKDCTFE